MLGRLYTEFSSKVRPQPVSVQAQPVRYPSQPGRNPLGSKCHAQGHKRNYQQDITLALNTTQGYKRSYQQAITLALNTTQGYKRSYQQAILYIPPVNLAIMCRGNLVWPTRKYLFESIVKVG